MPLPLSAVLAAFCASPLPVAVVDDFAAERRVIDPDGDLVYDLPHGAFIASLYKARGRAVVERPVGRTSRATLAAALEKLAVEIESGALRVSAVNLSQSLDRAFAEFNELYEPTPPVTPGNLAARREELLKPVLDQAVFNEEPELRSIADSMRKISAAGVPLLVSAGNNGPDKLNLLSLMPGAVTVGALDLAGRKALFSADNDLVEAWTPGVFVFRRVDGGVDLDRDGKPEIPTASLSGGPAVVSRWIGRPASESVSRQAPVQGEDKLYPAEAVADPKKPYELNDLLIYGSYWDFAKKYPFSEGASGKLVYDPERSGDPRQVKLVSGTSFTQPFLCPAR